MDGTLEMNKKNVQGRPSSPPSLQKPTSGSIGLISHKGVKPDALTEAAHLLHSKRVSLFVVQVLLQVEECVKEYVGHPAALQIPQGDFTCRSGIRVRLEETTRKQGKKGVVEVVDLGLRA